MTVTYDAWRYQIRLAQGATFARAFTVKLDGTNATDLTSYTARMQVRRQISTVAYLAEWTSAGSAGARLVLGGVAGTVTFDLNAATTAALPPGLWFYDVEIVSGTGVVTRILGGRFEVDPEVTR